MVTFNSLWKAHPTTSGKSNPCSSGGASNFPNQCAISVGSALAACGVNTKSIPGAAHCWHHDGAEGHVLRAEELAAGLSRTTIPGIHRLEKLRPDGYSAALSGRRGIVFFKDYWQRTTGDRQESFRNRSGDHIDLWNGSRLTDWRSWFRIRLGLTIPGVWSDLEESRQIWFWRVS